MILNEISSKVDIYVYMGKFIMEIDQIEWLRRENYFLKEQNEKLKIELIETKEFLKEILEKLELKNKN